MEVQIDPDGLARGAARSGVPVPALVAAFRKALQAPEHAAFVHWGATSQDIVDTALNLRLRRVVAILDTRLAELARTLGRLADENAEMPLVARTYGQPAVPSSVGARLAAWGLPLLHHRARLADLKPRLLCVSLSGAAGTGAAMGAEAPAIRARLAEALGLADPRRSWHATRDSVAEFAGWLTLVTGALGKIGTDLIVMASRGEALSDTGGTSSTMPQKSNPVAASVLVALARHNAALNTSLQGALVHGEERDGGSWFAEWLALPQMCLAAGRALALADQAIGATRFAPATDPSGLVHAEALSFALARTMRRPEAEAELKRLADETRRTGRPLPDLMRQHHPDIELALPQLGEAPAEARAFAAAAAAQPRARDTEGSPE